MAKKGRQFFSRKNGVTPSVAAPGDNNPSDATVSPIYLLYVTIFSAYFVFLIRLEARTTCICYYGLRYALISVSEFNST